jgi:hypothetical protein
MTVTTYDGLVAALPTAQTYTWSKATINSQAAGTLTSLWLATGTPGAGAIPTTWATCTDALTGSWTFTNPGGGILSYLSGFSNVGATVSTLYLYDRLGHMGGLNATTITAQTVSGVIPASRGAAVNGSDVEWFIEVYAAIGTTATTITASYTRGSDDTAGRITPTIAFGGASPANQPSRIYRIVPIAGETIKSIQTVTVLASTLTAGNFGITCAKRLCVSPMMVANVGTTLDFAGTGLPRVYDDACFWLVNQNSATATGAMQGTWNLIQG